ncbi:alpha-xenorhabdolysin family binary toxin subunit A [Pseudomonas sp. HR96]|uniref:alpha-xenorhabdolysin family binary toxin subunit A n=1 Tax=Pseudomonas sp. HR96 TaxID=1027966 RepID=UPI002A74A05A|nr:alpha-xenorhabdolysin family binary toxin subunit A [Pseudomonas sp. HR96]WPP00894.1 alpha-xenorhabdolysin family binary toxin subunit A [Pseudomonas sp. HR96]
MQTEPILQQAQPEQRPPVREPSILFTAQDLHDIDLYYRTYRRLPTDDQQILSQFSTTSKVLGETLLTAIRNLNQGLVRHAETWPELEEASEMLGVQLNAFSKSFTTTGQKVLKVMQATEAYGRHGARLAELQTLPIDLEADEGLAEGDLQAVESLSDLFVYMKEQVESYFKRVEGTYELAKAFRGALKYGLQDLLACVNEAMADSGIGDTLKESEAFVDQLTGEIEEQQATIEYYESAFRYSALFGPLGLAISYLTTGNRADDARAAQNALIAKREESQRWLLQANPIKGRISQYALTLSDMALCLSQTETAAGHLLKVWRDIKGQIDESRTEASLITGQVKLSTFALRFENIMAPWHEVLQQSQELLDQFEQFEQSKAANQGMEP